MNRRQFLFSSAAGIFAAPALLRGARAQEGPKLVGLGKGAAPHGVTIGPDGAPWVTEGGQNAIARVDPGDGSVRLFRLPEKYADANLNTGVFDKSGIYGSPDNPVITAGSIQNQAR